MSLIESEKATKAPVSYIDRLEHLLMLIECDDNIGAAFCKNPKSVMKSYDVDDILCEINGASIYYSDVVLAADEDARIAVARTLLRRVKMSDEDPGIQPRAVVPIANAAILANGVFVANGAFYANAFALADGNVALNINVGMNLNVKLNSNTMGENTFEIVGQKRRIPRTEKVILSEAYRTSDMYRAMDSGGYSSVRQGAMLKNAIEQNTQDTRSEEYFKGDDGLYISGFSYEGKHFIFSYRKSDGVLYIENSLIDSEKNTEIACFN